MASALFSQVRLNYLLKSEINMKFWAMQNNTKKYRCIMHTSAFHFTYCHLSEVYVTNKTGFGFDGRIYWTFLQLVTTVHKLLSVHSTGTILTSVWTDRNWTELISSSQNQSHIAILIESTIFFLYFMTRGAILENPVTVRLVRKFN
jgi:hypothetical protein